MQNDLIYICLACKTCSLLIDTRTLFLRECVKIKATDIFCPSENWSYVNTGPERSFIARVVGVSLVTHHQQKCDEVM